MPAVNSERPLGEGGPAEERQEAEVLVQPHLDRLEVAGEVAAAPQAEHHRRDGGQQVDDVRERRGEPARRVVAR